MKDFFTRLARARDCGASDVVEQDYHLHRLLQEVSVDEYLGGNLVFKGGTCLVKAYTGYFRFSQDIDFTWKDDAIWKGRSANELSAKCSSEISNIVRRFKRITDDLGLTFRGDKRIDSEVHPSSGGKMVELKPRYRSEVLGVPSEIKIQINLVDMISYPVGIRPLASYIDDIDLPDLSFLYPEPYAKYREKVELECYDLQEIFVEKCRAALTRTAYKPRDTLDILKMEGVYGYSIKGYRKQIIEKTRFALDRYERYRTNIHERVFPEDFRISGVEEKLLLEPLPGDIGAEARRVHRELEMMIDEILER
ncbi:MAG: hypothetical protein QG582_1267 [Candidatus Thermoplasmatota archaeon]|nr:hypothetical protein [Candidatus Thermoplasmatota archaeon]